MGLMEDLGAWLDQKKKNVVVNAQNLPGLLSSFTQDVQQGAAADKSAWDASRSVMPEVRAQGVAELNQRGQELGAMAPAGLLGWTAWHGSPHKFDKFDLSKIGTGEGAQAYGHGLYFADDPIVAENYYRQFDKAIQKAPDSFALKPDIPALTKGEQTRLRAMESWDPKRMTPDEKKQLRELQKKDGAYRKAEEDLIPKEAQMYKVDISDAKAPQDAFLQWDKPLSEQPQAIIDIAKSVSNKSPFLGKPMRGLPSTGEDLYRLLGASANKRLLAAGIPGIRYLDGGSRGAGSGTMNTVLFDDSLVKILERNGVPVEQPGLLAREPTKFQLAHAEAQRNAALPVAQGGLGLGPQNTAAQRMQALGFDTDVYHGTGRDFPQFEQQKMGVVSNGRDAQAAHFTSTNPKVSNDYAGAGAKAENETVYVKASDALRGPQKDELMAMVKNLTNSDRPSQYDFHRLLDRLVDHGPQSAEDFAFMEMAGIGRGAPNIMPLKVRGSQFSVTDFGGKDWNERDAFNAIAAAKAAGKDGATFTNIKDGLLSGDIGQTFAITDPTKVRSRFAAFDPKKRDSRDLLASMGLLGLLGAGAYGQDGSQ